MLPWFEKIITRTMMAMIMVIIVIATVWMIYNLALNTWGRVSSIENATDLQIAVQRGISGVLGVVLALELLETLKFYSSHHQFRLQTILVISAIAVARHIISLDFHHVDGVFLAGLGVLVASLVYGYVLLQRLPIPIEKGDAPEIKTANPPNE